MLFDSQVLTMTTDPSAGLDLAPFPTQYILAVDMNLVDHRLILRNFSHDSKIDPKETEIKLPILSSFSHGSKINPKATEIKTVKNKS